MQTLEGSAQNLVLRGFHVQRNFVSSELVAAFAGDYDDGLTAANQVYSLGLPAAENLARLRPRIEALIKALSSSSFRPTRIGGGVFFATGNGINFGWHQDHESYFINQTHRNYLNVYIPVVKPKAAKSNLTIVPVDNFAEAVPELWSRLEGGGASTFRQQGGRRWISDDCAGGVIGELDFDLDDLAETPELRAGDALLMRGDLFHRTQDNDTNRVALSVRVSGDQHTVTREHFECTCETKNWFLQQNAPMYDAVRTVFERHESLPLHALLEQVFALRTSHNSA